MSTPVTPTTSPDRRTRTVRSIAVGALIAGIVVLGYILLAGNGGSHSYSLIFQNAGQLVVGNEIQIGGVPHGSVDSIELTDRNQARIGITVDEPFSPLPEGTTAEIRSPSLTGVAQRYVALTLGANTGPTLDDGAELNGTKTEGIVDLDQIFNTFDAPTRKALEQFIQGSGNQFVDVAAELQQSAHYFSPSLSTSAQLFGKLVEDQNAFKEFLSASGKTMQALAEKSPQIEQLVGNASTMFAATAAQQDGLRQGIAELPATFTEGDEALQSISEALPDLTNLVEATKPAAAGLAPFLADLARLFTGLDPVMGDLGKALSTTKPSIVSATQKLPALQREFGPMVTHSLQALKTFTPILAYMRPYAPELTAFFSAFGQAGAAFDANGHYVRATPNFNDYQYTAAGSLTPNPPSTPLAGTQTGLTQRCPGSATQPTADGSAPFATGSCNPKQVPAG